MTWSAQQYTKYEDERTRPVRDLVAAIPTLEPATVIDLGCGPGNSTEVLAARYPAAQLVGMDSSPDMCAEARKRLPHARIDHAPIEAWSDGGPWGVIHANAVLHWVDDHPRLLPRLVSYLAPGGTLAIQMPDNLDEPAHVLMRELAAEPPWAAQLASAAATRTAIATPAQFFNLLRPHCARVEVWHTTYQHHLAGGIDAIVEWFKGSGLRPFLAPLESPAQTEYLSRYRRRLVDAYPLLSDGGVLLPFPRLFIVATR